MTQVLLSNTKFEFFIQEGDICPVNTEDGIGYYPEAWVGLIIDNVAYINEHRFLAKMKTFEHDDDYHDILVSTQSFCEDFIEKIKKHGSVNLSQWSLYKPVKRDLESEWRNDWEIEQKERSLA